MKITKAYFMEDDLGNNKLIQINDILKITLNNEETILGRFAEINFQFGFLVLDCSKNYKAKRKQILFSDISTIDFVNNIELDDIKTSTPINKER